MKRSSSMVLFLTICSFTKARGGEPAYDEKSAITSVLSPESKDRLLGRREAVRQIVTGQADLELQGNPLSEHVFNSTLAKGVDFGGRHTAAYLPAVHRYDGRFFLALGTDGRENLAGSRHHTLFLSGLYGLLCPSEPIQIYSCPLSAQVAERWNSDSLLTELLCEYMRRCSVAKIFDLTGVDAYRRFIDWPQVAETGAEVLHCFSTSAAGDSALPYFGKLLASDLLDLSEDELVGVQPETEVGNVRFESLIQYPEEELAAIHYAKRENKILQPLPSKFLSEYIRGGNPASSRSDGGDGGGREREWRFTAASKFIKDVKQRLGLFDQVLQAIEEIRQHPTSPRGNTIKRLTRDLEGMWRYRIGDFRLVYEPDDDRRVVCLLSISHRKDVYE